MQIPCLVRLHLQRASVTGTYKTTIYLPPHTPKSTRPLHHHSSPVLAASSCEELASAAWQEAITTASTTCRSDRAATDGHVPLPGFHPKMRHGQQGDD